MNLSGQQWVLKNVSFSGTTTGIKAGGTDIVVIGAYFEYAATGIDASGTSGSLTVVDTTGSDIGTLISSYDSGSASNSIILENIQNAGNTVTLNGNAVLHGNVADTWVHGDYVRSILSSENRIADDCSTLRVMLTDSGKEAYR
jgi:glucan 1,3-beta-glucosidase